jgi:hypothetical protein
MFRILVKLFDLNLSDMGMLEHPAFWVDFRLAREEYKQKCKVTHIHTHTQNFIKQFCGSRDVLLALRVNPSLQLILTDYT